MKKFLQGKFESVRAKTGQVAVGATLALMSGIASADDALNLPAAVDVTFINKMITSGFADITSIFTSTTTQMWTLAILVTVAFIGLRLFRKGANSAT